MSTMYDEQADADDHIVQIAGMYHTQKNQFFLKTTFEFLIHVSFNKLFEKQFL